MTYRTEFKFPDLHEFVQIGGEFADQMSAVRQCYDLKQRMPYITDYRVLCDGRIVFSRTKPLFETRPVLRGE